MARNDRSEGKFLRGALKLNFVQIFKEGKAFDYFVQLFYDRLLFLIICFDVDYNYYKISVNLLLLEFILIM